MIRSLLPRIVIVRTRPNPASSPQSTGIEYWSEDDYVTYNSRRALRWFGFTLGSWPYRKYPEHYWNRVGKEFVPVVRELIDKSYIPRLTSSSRVFEGGCNIGQNLYAIHEEFGSQVTGLDISPRAIGDAPKFWGKAYTHAEFVRDDALTTKWFDQIPNDHFDLAFTRWHLIHIPPSEAKRAYVASMKRIAKAFVIFEPMLDERLGTVAYHEEGRYSLAWEHWESVYGLREYRPARPLPDTRIFTK
jgi:hypothetical protein